MTWLERGRSAIRRHARVAASLLVLGVLGAENWRFFHGHYLGTATFPYDFSATYHAVPFYWQGVIRAGRFPSWIPFQAFGYPLALNLQSGLFYPLLWVFPAFGVTYSLHAAAALQCVHVFLGGVGAVVFARARKSAFSVALVTGFAYQVFGGFFGNSEHVDIVRGYALLPWLLAALTLGRDVAPHRLRAWLAAPIVYLVMTGAYPGQTVAYLAFAFGYLVLQAFEARLDGRAVGTFARSLATRAGAVVLGIGLSAVSVLPGWLMRGENLRVDEVGKMSITGLGLDHVFTTVFPTDSPVLSGDGSMRSLYFTVPVLFGLFFVRRAELRRHASIVLVAVAAAFMITGGAVFTFVARLVPMLGYSRFPAADYRALVVLPLAFLGATGLCGLLATKDRRWIRLAPILPFLAFVAFGAARLTAGGAYSPALTGLAIVVGALVVLAAATFVRAVPSWVLLVCVFPLMLFDAGRVHNATPSFWTVPTQAGPYDEYEQELVASMRAQVPSRPARARAAYELHREAPDLDGYLRGHYTSDDYAASEHLRVVSEIRGSAVLADYFVRESDPRLLPEYAAAIGPDAAVASDDRAGTATAAHFKPDRIQYQLSADTDGILIENEPAFQGWHGYVDCDLGREEAPDLDLWPIRAWHVPAGTQRFCVRFATPGMRLAGEASIAFLALWLAWGAFYLRRARRVRATGDGSA